MKSVQETSVLTMKHLILMQRMSDINVMSLFKEDCDLLLPSCFAR